MAELFDISKIDPKKLDEYAASDPIAKRVKDDLDKISTIMTIRYPARRRPRRG
jgi:hypothetical protein